MNVITMYPYICKYGKFPVGDPKLYVSTDCPPDCLDREGIIKCNVLTSQETVSSSYSVQMRLQTDVPFVFCLCQQNELR